MDKKRSKNIPIYDPDIPPVKTTVEIMDMLPHRYPFMMVDKIIELSDTRVVGVKNLTANEERLQGHFPGNPVFPGVLQAETLEQTGGNLALSLTDKHVKWETYFVKRDKPNLTNKNEHE